MADYDVITYTRPDNVVVNLSDPPYMLVSHDGFGIGELQHTTVSPPGSHGEYWYDTRMEAKVLSITFEYHGDDVFSRADSRRTIVRMFNPLLGPGVLRIDKVDGESLEIDCFLAESLPLPTDDQMGPGAYSATVRFKSHGVPAFRVPAINNLPVISGSTGGFTFPWSFPRMFAQSGYFNTMDINNEGDIAVPVVITLGGPLLNPIVRNETTGKSLETQGLNIGSQDVLLIDTDPAEYKFKVNGIDAWQYLTRAEFWDLIPGINRIVLDIGGTSGATDGTIEWYTRYLGM